MKKFEMTGRIVFEAEDIVEAFRALSEHFRDLADGRESELPLVGTSIKVKPLGSKTPIPPPDQKRTTYRDPRRS